MGVEKEEVVMLAGVVEMTGIGEEGGVIEMHMEVIEGSGRR